MAAPNLDGLTAAEITAVIQEATQKLYAAQQAEANAVQTRRQEIRDAVAALTTLLGPTDAAPGVTSIRAIRAFDAADATAGNPRGTTMGQNAGLALSFAFEGLEILTALVQKIALVTTD